MQDPPDPVVAETERILKALKVAVGGTGLSIRSVERLAGVSYTVFQKVLAGSTSLQYHHLLQILQAIRIDWTKFFNECYPPQKATAEPQPEPKQEESAPPPPDDRNQLVTVGLLEDRLGELAKQLGLKLPPGPPNPPP